MASADSIDFAEAIFRHGDVFRRCAKILFFETLGKPQLGLGYGTLAALSVEQYLKCLLQIEHEQYPESHDLQLLFNQLKTHTRERLKKQHDARASELPGLAAKFKKLHGNEAKANLDTLLEYGKNTFESFRYSYEKNDETEEVSFGLNLFGKVVRDRIVSIYPEWEEDLSTSQPQ